MIHRFARFTLFTMLTLNFSACSEQKGSDPASDSQNSAETFSIPDILAKTSWSVNLYNNSTGAAYTGFDGSNVFKILIGVSVDPEFPDYDSLSEKQVNQIFESPEFKELSLVESKKLSLEADAAFFKVTSEEEPFARIYKLVTLKAGTSPIKIKYGATEKPISIQVAAYTATQVAAGKQRYTTAVAGASPSPACASCHRAEGGADHSPFLMSQYSDGALLSTIETGVNSDDKYQTQVPHKMTFSSAAEKEGMVSYLRSLDPDTFKGEQVPK